MGLLFSSLSTERPNDILERLSYDIKDAKIKVQSNVQRRRSAKRNNFIFFMLVTIIVAVVSYIKLHSVGLLCVVAPIIVGIGVHYGIVCYYNCILVKNSRKLEELKMEKNKVLDRVKNTESYAAAKAMLDKYEDNDSLSAV